jgi:hypothetical protein
LLVSTLEEAFDSGTREILSVRGNLADNRFPVEARATLSSDPK